MSESKTIVNKAAHRPVEEIDLSYFLPNEKDIASIDLSNFLLKGWVLKEDDFRKAVENIDWKIYHGKYVCVYCSNRAIIPMWAYMIIAARLAPFAKDVAACLPDQAAQVFLDRNLLAFSTSHLEGKRVIVKGCGNKHIDERAYLLVAHRLGKVARVIMFGETCSSVPVYKKSMDE
jgi:hypothetical protein